MNLVFNQSMQMRCDFIEVRIVKDAHLPRFTMKKGELWRVRINKVSSIGFPLGGGFIESAYYEVIL